MKHLLIFALLTVSLISRASCSKNSLSPPVYNTTSTGNKMKITVGKRSFTATLYDNSTATAFKSLLPFTLNMRALNGNEKYVELSGVLPTDAAEPGTIHNGDLMLYGNATLVLFYETFTTPYAYTKIGRIDHPAELAAALGAGAVRVLFQLE